ncbi:MAG: FkbM family methyltransferase [Deltaproteobacteria bacterium]
MVAWQLWKRTVHKSVVVKLFNGYKFRLYPDCHESSSVVYFRVPDFREVTFLRRQAQGGVLIDVGANVGRFTLLLADRINDAILFEPNDLAANRARENLKINNLPYEIQTTALSDKQGEIFLEDRGGVDSTNRTVTDPKHSPFPVRKVPSTTLDLFLRERIDQLGDLNIIKIDVEGHESAVLKGAAWTLDHLRPKVVMFEYLQRTNLNEVREWFHRFGYHIYSLGENGDLVEVSDVVQPLQNLFAFSARVEPWVTVT